MLFNFIKKPIILLLCLLLVGIHRIDSMALSEAWKRVQLEASLKTQEKYEKFFKEFNEKVEKIPCFIPRNGEHKFREEIISKIGLVFAERYKKYRSKNLIPEEYDSSRQEKLWGKDDQAGLVEFKKKINEDLKARVKVLDWAVEQVLNRARY